MSDRQGNELASGVEVGRVESPTTTDDVAALLRGATAEATTVVPFGGCRSLATGNTGSSASVGLDTRGLGGVLAYEPTDLTLSVRAGTLWSEVQAELAAKGQELPLDVPFPHTTTIGGLFATGFAGPRRLRSGSLRDLVIGCEFVRGDGLVAKAGGMVVKNVSGFELPRFLHGSWGALAVVTSVNLKVVPIAKADGTFVATTADIARALAWTREMITGIPTLEAASIVVRNGEATVAIRAVGRDGAVTDTLRTLTHAWGSGGTELSGSDSRGHWQDLVDLSSETENGLSLSIGCRPRRTEELVHALLPVIGEAHLVANPGYGNLRVLANVIDGPTANSVVQGVARLLDAQDSMTVETAPVASQLGVDPWGGDLDGHELMRSIKREFDPAAVLNPTRLWI